MNVLLWVVTDADAFRQNMELLSYHKKQPLQLVMGGTANSSKGPPSEEGQPRLGYSKFALMPLEECSPTTRHHIGRLAGLGGLRITNQVDMI